MKLKEHLDEANLMDTYLRITKKDVAEIKSDLRKLEAEIKKGDAISIKAASGAIESSAKRIKDRMDSLKYH